MRLHDSIGARGGGFRARRSCVQPSGWQPHGPKGHGGPSSAGRWPLVAVPHPPFCDALSKRHGILVDGAKGSPRKGRASVTRLINPQQKKARALKMLEKRILEGKSTAQIAQEFGVSTHTAANALSFAAKGELMVGFEDTLLKDLVPLAQTAAKMALMEGNAKVALEVMKGVGLLRATHTRTQTQLAEEDALSRYIAQKRAHSQQLEDTYDAELNPTLTGAGGPGDGTGDNTAAIAGAAAPAALPAAEPDIEPSPAPVAEPDGGAAVETLPPAED